MVDVNDSLTSYVAGLGVPGRDKMATTFYGPDCVGDFELVNAYNGSWLAKNIVDIPANDAVKGWRNWQAETEVISAIEREEERLKLKRKVLEALISARLLGWSAIYIGVGDEDVSLPLNPRTIKRGGMQFLTVLSKRDVIAGDIDTDPLSKNYGKPSYYQVSGSGSMVDIHPSRMAIFIGEKPPAGSTFGLRSQMLGTSSLQASYTAIKNADSTTSNIASLVFEANVDVFGVPDLMASFSDPGYHERLISRFTLAATAKGINRALIRDKDEEYDRKQVSFSGLDSLMNALLNQVAGASGIPATKLLGISPAGLSSTGEADMNNYYDMVRGVQSDVGDALEQIDDVVIRSALGDYPSDIFYQWSSLEIANEKERAEIGKMNAESAAVLIGTGLFLPEELRSVVSNQLIESGFYPGLESAMAETGDNFDEIDVDLGLVGGELEAVSATEAPVVGTTAVKGRESLQQTALNGAQVASLLSVVMSVVNKEIPEEVAMITIRNSFPSIAKSDVDAMIASARTFEKPKEDENANVQPEANSFGSGS